MAQDAGSDVGKALRYIEKKRYREPDAEDYFNRNGLEQIIFKFSNSDPTKSSYNWILAGCSAGILRHRSGGERLKHYRERLTWVLVELNAAGGVPGSIRRMFEGEAGLSSYFGAIVVGPWAIQDEGIEVEGVREWLRAVALTLHLFVVPAPGGNRLKDPCGIPGCRFENQGATKNAKRHRRASYILRRMLEMDLDGEPWAPDEHATTMIAKIGRPILTDTDVPLVNRAVKQGTREAIEPLVDLVNSLGVGLRPRLDLRFERGAEGVAVGWWNDSDGHGPTHPWSSSVTTGEGVQSCFPVDKTFNDGAMGQQVAVVKTYSVVLSVTGSSAKTTTHNAVRPEGPAFALAFDQNGVRFLGDDGGGPDPGPEPEPDPDTEPSTPKDRRRARKLGNQLDNCRKSMRPYYLDGAIHYATEDGTAPIAVPPEPLEEGKPWER